MSNKRARVLTKRPLTKQSRPGFPARRTGAGAIIYHRIFKPRWINVIICEPQPGEYVWMCMYLRPALRNRQVCRELVQYILHVLHGRHHVHFFPEITTLVRLAREERWRSRGRSRFFNGCVAYETAGLEREPPIGPLLRGILLHRIQRRRPWLPTFGSRRSASLAIRRIQQHFRGTAVAERASAQ